MGFDQRPPYVGINCMTVCSPSYTNECRRKGKNWCYCNLMKIDCNEDKYVELYMVSRLVSKGEIQVLQKKMDSYSISFSVCHGVRSVISFSVCHGIRSVISFDVSWYKKCHRSVISFSVCH